MNIAAKWYFCVAVIINVIAIYVISQLHSDVDKLTNETLLGIEPSTFNVMRIRWWPYATCIVSILGLVQCFIVKTERPRMAHAAFSLVCICSILIMYCTYWYVRPFIAFLNSPW
jgi:hypothetical protein